MARMASTGVIALTGEHGANVPITAGTAISMLTNEAVIQPAITSTKTTATPSCRRVIAPGAVCDTGFSGRDRSAFVRYRCLITTTDR